MELRYFASGIEITKQEKDQIVLGETDKRAYSSKALRPLVVVTDLINVTDDKLDESDPVLIEILKIVNLPLDKTLIIQRYNESNDPLDNAKRAEVYGYW